MEEGPLAAWHHGDRDTDRRDPEPGLAKGKGTPMSFRFHAASTLAEWLAWLPGARKAAQPLPVLRHVRASALPPSFQELKRFQAGGPGYRRAMLPTAVAGPLP